MINANDALKAILEHTPVLQTEILPLDKALHSVLGETITARDDGPPFDSSAMDGYGVKVSDIQSASNDSPVSLDIVGVIKAGGVYEKYLEHGTTVKILTGAMVSEGVEAIVIKENTEESDGKVLVKSSVEFGENIRRQAEEFKKGDVMLSQGILITPPVIGLLAGHGYSTVRVHSKPKITVVVTGEELIDPKSPLEKGKVRDINTFTMQAALDEVGVKDISLKRAPDDPNKLLEIINQSLSSADILIVTGGVSIGDFDFVKEVFEKAGIEKVFWGIAIKPGKPTFFGTKGQKLIYGLPGNIVAVLVIFYLFVRPAIFHMMGRKEAQITYLPALMKSDVYKDNNRMEYLRGKLQNQNGEIFVDIHENQYSHMLSSFTDADCLVVFPKEQNLIAKDSKVQVKLLPWSAL